MKVKEKVAVRYMLRKCKRLQKTNGFWMVIVDDGFVAYKIKVRGNICMSICQSIEKMFKGIYK